MNMKVFLNQFICRYKCQAVYKQLYNLLVKFPSLKLRKRTKFARRIHGRLVVSSTIQRSCVMHIRVSELHLTLLCIPCSYHSVMGNTFSVTFDFLSTMYVLSHVVFLLLSHAQFKHSRSCLVLLRCVACLVKRLLAQAVSAMPSVLLCGLLLLAGDVEVNPGPITGKEVLRAP